MNNNRFLLIIIILSSFFSYNSFSQSNISNKVTVVSYNIQTGTHYRKETPELIAQFINDWNVDILATQEIHVSHAKKFDEAIPGFSWFGVGRDNGLQSGDGGETATIFYKTDKFELLDQNTFWLSETPEKPGSKSWGASDVRIVTWGKFLIKSLSKVIFVFNTHYDHISSLSRKESSKLLRNKMREIAGLSPIIVTGDFNCSELSEPYNILIANDPEDLIISNTEKICSSEPFGPSGSYNDFNYDNPFERIDFIFTNQYFRVPNCGIINEKPDGEFISDHFPVYVELEMIYPTAPKLPTLSATAGDGYVNLSWGTISEDSTYEPFLIESNDFQGYKLYRSRDPEMKDAVLVEDSWDIPLLRKPLLVSDKKDGIMGYTNYGIIDGFGYYLGDDSGLQHFYSDNDVVNGEKYYYVLTAYDKGYSEVGSGFAPLENEYEIIIDEEENVLYHSSNTAIIIPQKKAGGTIIPSIKLDEDNNTIGNAEIIPILFNQDKIIEKNKYTIKFDVDTVEYYENIERYRHKGDLLYLNSGFKIYKNDEITPIYEENSQSFTANNIVFDEFLDSYYLNPEGVATEEFDGIQFKINYKSRIAQFSESKSGWLKGDANIKILPSINESKYFPWQYEIVFTDNEEAYIGKVNKSKKIKSHENTPLGPAELLLKQKFNFYVQNNFFTDEDGNYEKLDLVVHDKDRNGVFNRDKDQILVGHFVTLANQVLWSGTVFTIDFSAIENESLLPKSGDVYLVDFDRPFIQDDEIHVSVDPEGGVVGIEDDNNSQLPTEYSLSQNYPNPFNPTTRINFSIPTAGVVELNVYNILGEKVATILNEELIQGTYTYSFDASKLSSGVYVYTIKANNFSAAKKMVLLK